MVPVLRPYQVDAIASARREFARGKKAVLLVAPTGAGKTILAAEIIRGAMARSSRCLFLAHRRELIYQTTEKLRSLGVEPGIIMAGEPMSPGRQCQVASIQTLSQRRDSLTGVDLIFFDEAHHAAAKSYRDTVALFPGARVVGLTATPWRTDGKGLSDVFDSHVVVSTPRKLCDEGWLAAVGGWEFRAIDTADAKVTKSDYDMKSISEQGRDKKLLGSIVGEYVARANGKRAVCFCVGVAASEATAEAFLAAGVPAEHLDGETDLEKRKQIIQRVRTGETLVVTNCAVLTEGVDLPMLEVAILAAPTLSPVKYLQQVGRVTRPYPGKQLAIIHDHCRSLATHGHPYAERDYTPCDPDEDRGINVRRKDADAAKTKQCPSCGSVRFGWPCPACGHRPSESELQEELRVEAVAISSAANVAKQNEMAEQYRNTSEDERKAAFMRFAKKHGTQTNKALGVYRWWSGDTAWPKREWKVEAGFRVDGRRWRTWHD